MNETTNQTTRWGRQDWILLIVNAVIFGIVILVFNHRLPDVVGSHYNVKGEQDGTMAKSGMWLLYAGIGIALPVFLSVVRNVDPRRQNYARFSEYYTLMRWTISLFIHGVFVLMILQNLDYDLPFVNIVFGGLGIMWMIIGNRMGQLRSNFFMGIRTPWTITDENNWRSTHRLGGRLWVVAGILMLLGACLLSAKWLIAVLIASMVLSVVIPYLYSYLLYAGAKKKS
ncbi:SdpI family protein [Paenibacillus sp. JDR-2]|uniref:SdpI family protein n=1 Tax=Paenibacillus sp. (strain JDR-2) TaxID=324057 RepID=UPI00016648A3|nr:SdpI family protein [Paenibacillus sp. JDR-2]ACT04080.1 integral membrane protein-like protein [Paenibacillus sp. JDR-2]